MIRVVLWDVDDTLLDFLLAEEYALASCLERIGAQAPPERIRRYSEVNRRRWEALERGEISREEVLLGRFEEFFRMEGIVCRDIGAFNAAYQLALGDRPVPRDDALNILRRLRGRVRQYGVTNGTAVAQERKLSHSGLDRLLDGVFISEKLGAEKPSPLFFDPVLEAVQPAEKREIVIIGDSLTSDILGGLHAGIRCWWYNGRGKRNDKGVLPDRELKDLHEAEALILAENGE